MGSIYQLTFFLALGLLAIVITIFVFAVSLLGRAMEAAATSEKQKLAERKKHNAEEMRAIKKEIEKAEASGQIPRGLRRKLDKLERRDSKFGKELSQIRKPPKLLTVRGGIVPCGVLLLAALVLTGLAWYLSAVENLIWMIHVFIWIPGLEAIGYTVSRIYQCLRVIESVAVPSEEAALAKETEAVKTALREFEEEKRPELELSFKDAQPPFHVKAESEILIEFSIMLSRGDVGRKAEIYFAAPPGFEFPDSPKKLPPLGEEYANYVCTGIECANITKGIYTLGEVKLKAPSQPKHYTLYYYLFCEGFSSEPKELDVVVE